MIKNVDLTQTNHKRARHESSQLHVRSDERKKRQSSVKPFAKV